MITVYRSRAIGGPLNNVILSGPHNWDGIIRLPNQPRNIPGSVHPGYYYWNELAEAWVWEPDNNPLRRSSL